MFFLTSFAASFIFGNSAITLLIISKFLPNLLMLLMLLL